MSHPSPHPQSAMQAPASHPDLTLIKTPKPLGVLALADNSANMLPVQAMCVSTAPGLSPEQTGAIRHRDSVQQGCNMASHNDDRRSWTDEHTDPTEPKPTENQPNAGEVQYLPVESPAFLRKFINQYFDTLSREASRICYQYNIGDYGDDALSITIEKFMTSRIEDRGPRSAISFAVRILKNTCIDEARRRGRHAIPAGALISNDDEEGSSGDYIEERVAEQTTSGDPEAQLIAGAEMNAVDLGFELLPGLTRKTHKNVERDLDIVHKRYLLRMSWSEIAKEMGMAKAHRQSAARGRELLRGWVHALCGTQPEPDAANRKYWQRGYEAGCAHREQFASAHSLNLNVHTSQTASKETPS